MVLLGNDILVYSLQNLDIFYLIFHFCHLSINKNKGMGLIREKFTPLGRIQDLLKKACPIQKYTLNSLN